MFEIVLKNIWANSPIRKPIFKNLLLHFPWILSYVVAIIPILVYFVALILTASFAVGMTGLTATSILEFLIAVLLLVRKE